MKMLDVENRTGMDRATIRFYEKEGLVIPTRHDNGYRSYSNEDVSQLLKIKLLRQLGVSIDKIRNLQQGSEDFSSVLSHQIEVLSNQIDKDTSAKHVCLSMQQDNVQFETMEPTRYLNMLCAKPPAITPHFQELPQVEHHPWRRYFARTVDYSLISAVILSLLVIVLRIRPFSANAIRALNYLSYIIVIPILACMQHFWGTTPGKWAMGIRLEHIDGGKLDFHTAICREFTVFCMGFGLNIPFISIWRLYKSYKQDTEGEGNTWNSETEIIFSDWTHLKKIAIVLIAVASSLLSLYSSLDTMLPKHRGEGITIKEFVRNYQDYEKVLDVESMYLLTEDGLWEERTQNHFNIVILGDSEHTRSNFSYEVDNSGNLTSISYSDTWEDASFQNPIPAYCTTAIYALLGSRPGSSQNDLVKAEELIVSQIHNQLAAATQQGSFIGEFTVNDVKVSWNIAAENCDVVTDSGWMVSVDEDVVSYSLDLLIEVVN